MGGTHHLVCSAPSTSRLHQSRSPTILSYSCLFTSDLSRSLLTLSVHLNFGLLLLLLPPSYALHSLFVNISTLILCMCPAHCSVLPTMFNLRCFFVPISSLYYPIFLLSSRFILHILRTQLFSATCNLH